ncbi:MAG: hypothetical protein ACOZAL_00335 [Patescibacteria group bacterium]
MKNYPNLKFVINKKKELETFLNFYSWSKHQKKNRDLNWAIYKPHPKLRRIKKKSLLEQKIFIHKYIDNFYKQNINEIKNGVLKAKKDWKKVEKDFFILVDEIFKEYPWPNGKYIAYSTIWGMYPRYLNSKTFLFPYSHNKKNYILIVIAHEMLHFMFYDYVYTKFSKLKSQKYNFVLWNMSEIFNAVIQNSKKWISVFHQKTMGYPEHKKHISKFKKYWQESKNIDIWIKKSFDYLKNSKPLTF